MSSKNHEAEKTGTALDLQTRFQYCNVVYQHFISATIERFSAEGSISRILHLSLRFHSSWLYKSFLHHTTSRFTSGIRYIQDSFFGNNLYVQPFHSPGEWKCCTSCCKCEYKNVMYGFGIGFSYISKYWRRRRQVDKTSGSYCDDCGGGYGVGVFWNANCKFAEEYVLANRDS